MSNFQNQTQIQTQSITNSLKQIPGGELVLWLETQLSSDNFESACDYILETLISQLIVICDEKTQMEMNNFLEKGDFEQFFVVLGDLLDKKNANHMIFRYQLLDAMQLGFEVMVLKYQLDTSK